MTKSFSKFLFPIFLVFFSCTQEEICKAIHLADMVCSKLAVAVPTVQTGAAFAITTIVKNVAASTNFCETEIATASSTEYNVMYREDQDMPWQPTQFNQGGQFVFDVYVPTSPLDPDQTTGFEPGFMMDTPGQYRFAGSADGLESVPERNEGNNGKESDGTLNGKSSEAGNFVIVTVTPSKNYVPKKLAKGELPKVTYLGYKKLW